ncbi:MAG: uracil-DNA glycosylase family protein [Weeksellaceae bacterium]
MFKHQHPYPPFIPKGTDKLIVGTLPPPRFTTGQLKPGDVDFCYGSRDGQLWLILGRIFETELENANTENAVRQRIKLLEENRIGICDMVECAFRNKMDASDAGILNAKFRPMIPILTEHENIRTLLFTGGNSRNGPEYFFRKYLKKYPEIKLEAVQENIVPRIYSFRLGNRMIKTVSLTAPSGAANRAVGAMDLYKKMKAENPAFDTIDFRVMQYKEFFLQ